MQLLKSAEITAGPCRDEVLQLSPALGHRVVQLSQLSLQLAQVLSLLLLTMHGAVQLSRQHLQPPVCLHHLLPAKTIQHNL